MEPSQQSSAGNRGAGIGTRQVIEYYRHTRFDYRTIWNRRSNLAVHFGFYDEQARVHHDALNNMNRVLADLAGIRPGDRVLDAGCGMGGSCLWLARHRQARVTGISIVPEQIEDCRRFAADVPGELWDFQVADYCATPFPDASFDVVWACESVCHAPHKGDFYREAWRLLKPGGRLVVAEYLRSQRPLPEAEEQVLAAWLHPWAISDLDTEPEHRQWAEKAGFSNVEIRDVTANVQVSLRNLHHLCRQWLPWGKLFRRLRIVNQLRLDNVRASISQYEALKAGAWSYGMITADKMG